MFINILIMSFSLAVAAFFMISILRIIKKILLINEHLDPFVVKETLELNMEDIQINEQVKILYRGNSIDERISQNVLFYILVVEDDEIIENIKVDSLPKVRFANRWEKDIKKELKRQYKIIKKEKENVKTELIRLRSVRKGQLLQKF